MEVNDGEMEAKWKRNDDEMEVNNDEIEVGMNDNEMEAK